ncbi:MAG TPA: tetratricopeptide repeat protein [Thermoanaerobaculia bacterium]|nr:tetratricopeptide repeat protein [Thermoanaerobaculia bacterium]
MISTRDPRLLGQVIADLEGAAEQVPPGQARWRMRTNLADALRQGGRPDAALPFYEQAAEEAETAEDWSDMGVICQNWASGLGDVGRLDDAKATYRRSAEAQRRAGSPRVNVLLSEFEALRVDVMQGEAERALPEIESRLQEVRGWWRRHREGETVPEAPDAVALGRALTGGLDIAKDANQALERWEACLGLLTELEEAERALGEGEHEMARTRFNRYGPLLRLGRLDEAQEVLESCLEIFRAVGDLSMEAKSLSALSDLWNEREDREQAVGLGRQALAARNRLSDLVGRSISHGNLANYLDRLGEAEEAARHRLVAIVYDLVMGHRQFLATDLRNLAILMRNATASGKRYELPRLAELVARPEFEALRRTLAERNVGVEALQAEIDRLVAGLG